MPFKCWKISLLISVCRKIKDFKQRYVMNLGSYFDILPVAMGAYHLQEKSGWCNRCIMVRDFPNSTDQLDEIALTIYLS